MKSWFKIFGRLLWLYRVPMCFMAIFLLTFIHGPWLKTTNNEVTNKVTGMEFVDNIVVQSIPNDTSSTTSTKVIAKAIKSPPSSSNVFSSTHKLKTTSKTFHEDLVPNKTPDFLGQRRDNHPFKSIDPDNVKSMVDSAFSVADNFLGQEGGSKTYQSVRDMFAMWSPRQSKWARGASKEYRERLDQRKRPPLAWQPLTPEETKVRA